jgi:predicted ribosome quality control (RQC) complex YloA/Tae2 family protein
MSNLEDKKIEERSKKLDADIQSLQQTLIDLDRKKGEATAQLNAMLGAKQQCQMFLSELRKDNNENDLGENSKKDPKKDLGGLE